MSRNEHAALGHGEARQEPVWKNTDFNTFSGAYQYRNSAQPTVDVAHEADPENVPPAQMHVTMSTWRHIPQGYHAYVTRGDQQMAPGRTRGRGASGWGFRTKRRAEWAAQAMMNRINRDGDSKYSEE